MPKLRGLHPHLSRTHMTAAEIRKHVAAYPELHLTSSEKGMGIAALRAAVVADALGEGWMG